MRRTTPLLPLLRALLTAAALAFAGCAAIPPPRSFVNLVAPNGPVSAGDRPAHNARVFDEAWDWVNRRYYDAKFNGADWAAARERHRAAALAAPDDATLYREVNALLGELHDGHARAYTPAETAERKRRRGVLLGFRTSAVEGHPEQRLILEVFPGSAAAHAGVKAGWLLLRVNDLPPSEVLGRGKLHEGDLVRCEFRDTEGTARALELRPRVVRIPPIREAIVLSDGKLLLRFDYFDNAAARWLREQLKAYRTAPGVIIDLRHNVGGEGFAMMSMLSEIFHDPVALGRTIVRSGGNSSHRTPRAWFGADYRGPIAVLVSERSTSAAEIFADVVQYHHRGTVLGTKTPGIVLVSVFWWLPGGGELQLSVYDFEGPAGTRLEGRGVTPDVIVSPAVPADPAVRGEKDPAVVAAQRALNSGAGK